MHDDAVAAQRPVAPSWRKRAAPFLLVAALGPVALIVACIPPLVLHLWTSVFAGSLLFSSTLILASVLARVVLAPPFRDRGSSLAAFAGLGAAPFIAFCCERALTIPTQDTRPLEGIGTIVVGALAVFLLATGPAAAFVIALPLGVWANRITRILLRLLVLLAIAAALPLTAAGVARRLRFPDPDGYVASLPLVTRVEGDTCPSALCVRCPGGTGPRPLVRITAAGPREAGEVQAPCDDLEFRYDAAHGLLLVGGDADRITLHQQWPSVWVYEEATGKQGQRSVHDLRDTLAPPTSWVFESALGVLGAMFVLLIGVLRPPRGASEAEADARAILLATVALAMVVLLATPLATAWHEGLLPCR